MLCLTAVLVVSVVLAGGPGSQPAGATVTGKPRVTLIGDSIAASLDYVPSARALLGRGLELRSNTAICRRLVARGCLFRGARPATALDVVRARGPALGSVVVIDVGYNDWAAVYDVDRVMQALEDAHVRAVVWVTLRETTSNYARDNDAIRRAAGRYDQLVVADWNTWSAGKKWFLSDGLQLTEEGAVARARFLRPLVLEALRTG